MSAPPPLASPDPWWRPELGELRPGLAELVLEVAATSVAERDAEALLRAVCAQLTQLCGLTGCAAVLFDGSTGAVRTLVASHPEAEQLTRLVQQLGLGIGSAAIRAGRGTAIEDLSQSVRSGLAEAAQRVGLPVTAVVALHGAEEELVGCLQLYSRSLDTLAGGLLGELAPLADVLGSVLGNLEAYRHSASLVARLTNALDRQGPIEQAKGMLSERHGVDLDAAYRMLRDEAHRQATAVVAVAAELVNQSWRVTGGPSLAAEPTVPVAATAGPAAVPVAAAGGPAFPGVPAVVAQPAVPAAPAAESAAPGHGRVPGHTPEPGHTLEPEQNPEPEQTALLEVTAVPGRPPERASGTKRAPAGDPSSVPEQTSLLDLAAVPDQASLPERNGGEHHGSAADQTTLPEQRGEPAPVQPRRTG